MTREQVDALREVGIDDKTIIDLIIKETAEAVAPAQAEKPEPEKQPEPEKTPEKEKQPEPEKTPEPEKHESGKEDKILAAIEKLTGAIYNHNVLASGGEDPKTESAEDIIGKMLRKS